MSATIFQIPLLCTGMLAITPRPRGGDWLAVDLAALSVRGIQVLVSLLESEEAAELGLVDELACCAAHGIEFLSLPVPDLGAPLDSARFVMAATALAQFLREGKQVAVHCRQSVGRSGLLAVSVAVASGLEVDEAVELYLKPEGCKCLRR